MLRHVACSLVLGALSLSTVGCAEELPEFGQVTGVVTANGKPVKDAVVTFMPEPSEGSESPINASSMTDDQGRYELKYGYKTASGVGAPLGWHRVLVQDTRMSSVPQGGTAPPRTFSIDYSSPGTTPLKFEVKPGPQTFDIQVAL